MGTCNSSTFTFNVPSSLSSQDIHCTTSMLKIFCSAQYYRAVPLTCIRAVASRAYGRLKRELLLVATVLTGNAGVLYVRWFTFCRSSYCVNLFVGSSALNTNRRSARVNSVVEVYSVNDTFQ